MNGRSQVRCDLLSLPILRSVVRWRGFPVVFQAAVLVVLAGLVINGWNIGQNHSADEVMMLRKTNLTTLVVWGLWWPVMIALALGFGRAWCTVCPMELVNRVGDAVARRVGWPRAPLGRWLKAGWLILLAYLALQVLVAGVSIHRVPHYTSVMLITMFAAALATGLAFREPRSFCRAFCPAEALLSAYGRYTPLQLDVKDAQVCEACETRDCIAPENREKFDARSCPSQLVPFKREPSDGCVLCFQCAKVCPHENLGFGLVRDDAGTRRQRLLKPFEAGFVMVAAGFVAHEVVGEVKWLDKCFHTVPEALDAAWPGVGFGWFEGLWFLVLFPAVLWAVTACLAYTLGHRSGWRKLFLAAATGAAPVIAIAHLAKAIAKVSSWGGYLPLAVAEPVGVDTFNQIAQGALAAPSRLLSFPLLGWIMLLATLLIGWRSWRWMRQAADESLAAARAGCTVVTVFFVGVLVTWLLP